ncbi:MAG: DNA polymerase-3 subunit alpha [Pseudohongiellaceae bacterium]|jgi:DNA polymerase-3 subunit alpha
MPENLPAQAFAHLRLHTEFSISDGLVTIAPLIDRLLELKMPTVAITDIANLFGLIKFYSKSISSGIKPLCGCDVLVRDLETGLESHLVLLVQDKQGYLNLTELISEIYTDANGLSDTVLFKSKLEGRTAGLIALSGAQLGDVGRALLADEFDDAKSLLGDWQKLFPNRFYLELQRLGKPDEEDYIEKVLELSQLTACPVVATNDVRFLKQEDFEAHEVRVCINERRSLDDPRRVRTYTDQQYLKTQQEMSALFVDIPEALENAWEIAKRCNIKLDLGTPCLPNYPTPAGVKLEDYLSQVSTQGLETRLEIILGENIQDPQSRVPYSERLETELKIINQMGFAGYFLIVMEFIQWSKDNGIPVGPGRGSGAGSIVAYALGITDIDPLKYDLLFERFLNPERVSMPDFDVDFCMDGRDKVIAHVAELYGKDAVSQIITFGTMAAKAVVRDVARVQGKPYSLADKLSKLIPFEPGITLKKAFEDEPLLGEFVDSDEDAQEIMEMAYKLEGITRNVGKHAGGVVIAPTKLTDFTPLYCDDAGQNLVTQFDKNDVETAGLVKFDFLGLRTLTIIDWAVKMINAEKADGEPLVDINELPLNDQAVYRLLQQGETTAVFQLESRGMKELIKRQVPNSFEDIIALVALFRPGPLQSGMVDDFIDRKHGRTRVEFPHPELEPVLGNTYGVILYQEQVMKIAQVLANYTLGGADILRKAMGKKNPAVMAKQRTLFVAGAKARDVDVDLAESIFDLMEKFAGYGFNKSHSAAYALVSYQTAWLKTHYPAYFMAAVLSADMDNTEKVVTLIEECRSMKLEILPPDINIGQFNFTVNDAGQIVYGLGAIKGLGEGPVGGILNAREDALFTTLLDVCQRVDSQTVNKRTMEALVRSGAMDSLVEGSCDYVRALLSYSLPQAMKAAEQSSRNRASGVQDLFGEITPVDATTELDLSALDAFQPWQEQQRLLAEKETLGLYLSGHPIDEFLPELSHLTKNRLLNLRPERGHQITAGLLHAVRTMKSKAGDTIAFLTLDDRSARFEVALYGREYEKYRELLHKDVILVVECNISVDDFSGSIRGRAKDVMTLTQARKKFANRLSLDVEASNLTTGFSDRLAAILSPYQLALQSAQQPNVMANSVDYIPEEAVPEAVEGCQVMVNYRRNNSRGCIILGPEWKVSPSDDLIKRLKSEFGKDKLEIKYSRPSTLS